MTGDVSRKWSGRLTFPTHLHIGNLFIGLAVLCGLSGGVLSFLWQEGHYAASSTMLTGLLLYHLVGIVFLGFSPLLFQGLGLLFMPILMESKRMVFPWVNVLSLFLQLCAVFSYFVGLGEGANSNALEICLLLWGASLLFYMTNMTVSILNGRGKAMNVLHVPSFIYAQLFSAVVAVFTLPVCMAHLVVLFLKPASAALKMTKLQHFLQAYDFAVVALLLLPVLGIAAHSVQTFSGRLKYKGMFDSFMLLMACMGGVGWTHWVFHSPLTFPYRCGVQDQVCLVVFLIAAFGGFSLLTMNLLYVRFFRQAIPLYWVIGLLIINILGYGGLVFKIMPLWQFHSFIAFDCLIMSFGSFYLWSEKITGWRFSPLLAKIHFSLTFSGILITLWVGGYGHGLSKIGVVLSLSLMGLSLVTFICLLCHMVCKREVETRASYWGSQATTGEWQASTPLLFS